MDAAAQFLVVLGLSPVFIFGVVAAVRMMVMGDIDAGPGILAIVVLIALATVVIVSNSLAVGGGVFLILALTMAFFPFALTQLAAQEMREINVGLIDKFHAAISAHGDNIAAYFALSEALYRHGFQGHAIGLATKTLEGLSTELDPMKFESVRGLFRREEDLLRRWLRESTDPRLHQPIKCPLCGFMNPPGNLACGGCAKPFLLEVVRRTDVRSRFLGKLVVAWSCLAAGLGGAVWCGFMLHGVAQALGVLSCVAVAGGVTGWVLRPARGDQTTPTSYWIE